MSLETMVGVEVNVSIVLVDLILGRILEVCQDNEKHLSLHMGYISRKTCCHQQITNESVRGSGFPI